MTGSNLILLIGVGNALALSAVLWLLPGNRAASRVLGLLILLLTMRVGPHILDLTNIASDPRHLVFVPLDFSYAFGPLLWLYVARLTHMPLPRRWCWHLAPTVIQLGYLSFCFLLPFEQKWAWYIGGHQHFVGPVASMIGLGSLTAYLILSLRMTARYRAWIDASFAERDEVRLFGLSALLIAFGLSIVGAGAATLFMRMAAPHDFDARFPLMAVIALLTYALGMIGWRNAGISFPPFLPPDDSTPANDTDEPASGYRKQAEAWEQRIRCSNWWQDETLDLAGLAARLGTTPRTLSRVIREGLNENFRGFIGRIRVDAVCAAFETAAGNASIIEIAFASGFSSKASFNRVFLQHRGMTPSAYRATSAKTRLKNGQSSIPAGFEATENRP